MIRSASENGIRLWRCATAALAALTLVYAAILALSAPNLALSAAPAVAMAAGYAGHGVDGPAKKPCDTGSALCRDCAPCSIAALPTPVDEPALLAAQDFIAPTAAPPANPAFPPPPEPPRA
ncbi:MAG TPA: hypothetical protein VF194_18870 [Ferrovibrio sp.]|jgi:hypothetical protein|uniref:hypothetical protein n=1 Tax=Ferrovibrio sp. TaxID=1917215 RepID=UPI002ED40458